MMATSQAEASAFTVNDVTVCPICLEKYKTPRYLPCKHSFCHDCLHSYIVSQSKSTEPRLGFHCPICRVYIPSLGDSGKSEEWADRFPMNVILQKMVEQPNEKHCEACLRDGDEEEAADFCVSCNEYLCKLCTKYHRKNLGTRDHDIFTVDEMKSMQVVPKVNIESCCFKHQQEKVQLYCHDHEQACCALCGGTEHRKCDRVDTVEDAVTFLRENGQMESLLNELSAFQMKYLKAKTEEEKTLSEIENTVDENVANVEKEYLELVHHLEKLKSKHIEELFVSLKEGKEKLQRKIERLDDGILCLNHSKTEVEDAQKKTENDAEVLAKIVSAKRKLLELKSLNFSQLHVTISVMKTPKWREFTELTTIADVKLSESCSFLNFDIRTAELKKFKEFPVEAGNVFFGVFLSEGRFLIPNHNAISAFMVYDKNWKCIEIIGGLHYACSAYQCENEIFLTKSESKTIDVFSSTDFHKLRSITLNDKVYGITGLNGYLYAACETHILKLNKNGQILKKYKVDGSNNVHVTTTQSGLIVFGNFVSETITAMTEDGRVVWKYQSPNLKGPHDLDTDSCENIYVAGSTSNNVHVLSNTGELVRVIEGIPSPYFFKINEEERVACVCSKNNTICVYRF